MRVQAVKRAVRLGTIWATLLATMALANSVHAAAFRTRWDPIFNLDFSVAVGFDPLTRNVGWEGTALIEVADACVSPGVVSFPDSCGGATLQSYTLSFYDTSDNSSLGEGSGVAPLPAVDAVSFDSSSIANGFSLVGPIAVGSFSFDGSDDYDAFLSFDLGVGAGLLLTATECDGDECPVFFNDFQRFPATVTWSRVPAPASIWLLGLGVLALTTQGRRQPR